MAVECVQVMKESACEHGNSINLTTRPDQRQALRVELPPIGKIARDIRKVLLGSKKGTSQEGWTPEKIMHTSRSSASKKLENRNQKSFILCMDLGPDFPDPQGVAAERLAYWGKPRKTSIITKAAQAALGFAFSRHAETTSLKHATPGRPLPARAKDGEHVAPKPARARVKKSVVDNDSVTAAQAFCSVANSRGARLARGMRSA